MSGASARNRITPAAAHRPRFRKAGSDAGSGGKGESDNLLSSFALFGGKINLHFVFVMVSRRAGVELDERSGIEIEIGGIIRETVEQTSGFNSLINCDKGNSGFRR